MVLLLLIGALPAFSQAEKVESRYAAARFKTYHNNNKADSIYTLFSPDMQAALPADKAREFLTSLKSQAGAIKSMAFNRYEGPYASYITVFEKGTFVVNIALDTNHKVNGFFVQPHTDDRLPKPERNVTKLNLPFKEEWTVVWGGDTRELNYHVENTAQKNAFDMIIKDNTGKSYRKDGKTNEDYYAFGKPLFAP